MSKFRPLTDRILVRPPAEEKILASGIIIPDTIDKELPSMGEVVRVGPGRFDDSGHLHEMGVVEGETIYYGRYAGYELKIDGVDMKVVRMIDVMGVAEED